VPEKGFVDDVEQTLPKWYWKIYGDFQTAPIVLLENTLAYKGANSVFFLSERDGTSEQVYKRRGKLRALLIDAKKRIETTKDSHGYHMGDHSFYQIFDSHLYAMVITLVCETRQPALFTPTNGKEEQKA